MKSGIIARNPLAELIEFAEDENISAIFRNTDENGKTVYYLIKPEYDFDDYFENKISKFQKKIFPENNTIILCTSKSREDRIWAESVRVYWHTREKRRNEPAQI